MIETRITKLFGIRYPIIQTGMGWVSGPELTCATSNAGGLGILAAATLTYNELDAAIGQIKEKTTRPFGVNLRVDQADLDQRLDLMIQHDVALASFVGAPTKTIVDKLKNAGILTMPTVGARRHAEKVAALGVDAIIAQGHEGGGHTGPVPTTLLLPEVVDAVDIPVLGAGGFSTGRGLVAALAYGAGGIAMGTRFLLTQESRVPAHIKTRYLATKLTETVVTTAIDGAPQRVIVTPSIAKLERASTLRKLMASAWNAFRLQRHTGNSLWSLFREGLRMRRRKGMSWSQLLMAPNAPMLTRASMVDGVIDAGILPTGQVVGVIDKTPSVQQVMDEIMNEAERTVATLTSLPHVPTLEETL